MGVGSDAAQDTTSYQCARNQSSLKTYRGEGEENKREKYTKQTPKQKKKQRKPHQKKLQKQRKSK